MTAHWIEVTDGNWELRNEVIGFKDVSGAHSGDNVGQYSVGLLDRVGIMSPTTSKACGLMLYSYYLIDSHLIDSQLYTATLDNASNNTSTTETIEKIHARRGLPKWDSKELQLP